MCEVNMMPVEKKSLYQEISGYHKHKIRVRFLGTLASPHTLHIVPPSLSINFQGRVFV